MGYCRQVFRAVLALVLVALTACAVMAQGEKNITEIVVAGNKSISREAILTNIESKPGMPFSRDKMISDRTAIEKMGFFSVASAKDEEVPGGVKITFEVVENPKITKIEFTGNTVATRQELLDVMRTKEGQVYNSNTLQQDLDSLEDVYRKRGNWAYVSDADVDPGTGVLTLQLLEFRVGKIQFNGLKKTKPWVLQREMKLKPGMIYNAFTLQKDIQKVYDLGILDPEKYEEPRREPSDREGYLDIIIPVTEKKTGRVTLGLGYSSLQKVVGRVEATETNLQGLGLGVNALYEMSGTGTGASYELGFYNPWLRKDHTSLSVQAYNREIYRFSSSVLGGGSDFGDNADYRERRKGGTVTLARPFGETLRGFVTLRQESVNTEVDEGAVIDPDILLVNQDGHVTSIALRGVIDTRDSQLDPAVGRYNSLSWEPGWSRVDQGSGNTFTKIEADFRQYISKGGPKKTPKDKRRTLALRAQGSWSTGFLPFWEQFFLGGAERLRGYREDRFWGNRMLLGSAEYRVPLAGGLGGVVFADYGDAWGQDYRSVSPNLQQSTGFEGHLGYGLGLRVSTPIGNLRFDYGFGDEGSRTHFSIGQAF